MTDVAHDPRIAVIAPFRHSPIWNLRRHGSPKVGHDCGSNFRSDSLIHADHDSPPSTYPAADSNRSALPRVHSRRGLSTPLHMPHGELKPRPYEDAWVILIAAIDSRQVIVVTALTPILRWLRRALAPINSSRVPSDPRRSPTTSHLTASSRWFSIPASVGLKIRGSCVIEFLGTLLETIFGYALSDPVV